jgi:polyphosphate kinase
MCSKDDGERPALDPPAVDVDLSDPAYYLNRELSELAFQDRVLHEALDDRNPLLERVRFLSIFTKNMDEFFMKRVGGLKQQIEADITDRTADGRTPREQWEEVLETARPMFEAQTECYRDALHGLLDDAGIEVIDDAADLREDERSRMREYFEESVLPTLTPLAFDPAHPFPFISNLSLSLAVLTRQRGEEEPTFTRVKIPQNRPRLVELDGSRYVLIEEVIRDNLDLLFPNVDVVNTSLFRLTRNAEVRRHEEVAEDLIDMIEEVLEQRRFATVVRLEVTDGMPEAVLSLLMEQLELDEREVYRRAGPLDYRPFMELTELDRPELTNDPWTPQPHPRLRHDDSGPIAGASEEEARDVFKEIRHDDVLLHHPYHSFGETVQRFLDEAAADPDVLAIKAAIYRTASDSKVIQSLIDAAENGKQVAVMVELKARFDEENNLDWVRTLEENGIHVAYGTVGLKTHTKTALVVRDEPDGVQLYSHVGTGNYHSETAKGYVDLGLLTADREIGRDLTRVFNYFTGPSLDEQFGKLLISPVTMRPELTRFVRREAEHARNGERARIVVKVNGLEDPGMVEELYRAAMAGVEIDLIVRDICRLRPGLEGVSESVTVHSVVGQFLEHSRIFYFENGGDPEYYLGSADWMTRNLDNRVEAVAPVEAPAIREQLRFNLELILADNRRRWVMHPDGSYTQQRPEDGESVVDTQAVLMDRTREAVERDGWPTGIVPEHPAVGRELLVEPVEEPAPAPTPSGQGSDPDRDDGDGDGGGDDGGADPARGDGEPTPATDGEGALVRAGDEREERRGPTDGDLPPAFGTHPDRWYVPDSDRYEFTVRTPDGDRRYYESVAGAADALEELYG